MPDADDLLSGLDPEQAAVARALRGPVCVVAGAGTGKTRALTHRIAYGVATGIYKPTEVLAVTFTTRAAGEMRGRLGDLGAPGVQARTFHSAALRQARYFWPQVYGGEFPEIIASKFGLVAEAARRLGVSTDTSLLRDLSSEIEWSKVSTVRPADYVRRAGADHRSVADLDAPTVASIMTAYEDIKRERGRIDMEDILLITAAILGDDERIAAQVRRQYRWFVVDEFQDVNPLQQLVLDQWLGGRDDICVVGDPRQTIYSFAGATPGGLRDFTRRHDNAERFELVRNYRSTPQIVAVANAVFPRRRDVVEGVTLQAQSPAGDPVAYLGHPDEPAEAAAVASEIALLHRRGVPYREMAVLFRINAQSEAFEEALGAQQIPYVLRGAEGFFQRAEVRQAVALLRGAAVGAEGSDAGLPGDVRAILAAMAYSDTPPAGAGATRDRWESLHALVSMADDLAATNPAADLVALVTDLDRRAAVAHAPTPEGVTLATLHSAKGLEWDAVFCVGMHEGMMPSVHADTPAAVDEERRLFYVGLTRARRYLTVTWSATRRAGGRGQRPPTRFLDPLVPRDHESRRPADEPRRRKVSRCRVCESTLTTADERKFGRCVSCPSTYDEALFERLREWRSATATERKVPAFVVFNDATLQAIAEAKPTTDKALLALPGVGRSKLDAYGESVLLLVSEAG